MGFPSPRPGRVTELRGDLQLYSTFRAQPPGEYSHRPAGTQTPLDWHPRSFSWHPNRYEAGTQSLFESDQPNERTRNALILFRVALYDCLWRRSNSERDPPTRLPSLVTFWFLVVCLVCPLVCSCDGDFEGGGITASSTTPLHGHQES